MKAYMEHLAMRGVAMLRQDSRFCRILAKILVSVVIGAAILDLLSVRIALDRSLNGEARQLEAAKAFLEARRKR